MTPEDAARLPYRDCVGLVLRNPQGLVFAGERSDVAGAWQMPQGGIDRGESPAEAALRELEEETSVPRHLARVAGETAEWHHYDLPLDVIPRRWGGRFRGQRQKWFLVDFLGDDSDINLATATPEFARWRWMSGDDLVAVIVPFKRDLYVATLSEFGLLGA